MGLFNPNPEKRRRRKVARLKRRAGRGNLRAMQKLQAIEDFGARKDTGPTDAQLRQAQQVGQQAVGAQVQGLMSGVAPVGPVGSQTGASAQQMAQMGEAAAEGAAAASGQAFASQSKLQAQAQEALKARIARAGEFQAQQAAQTASMIIGGVGAAGSVATGVGALI